MGGCIGGDAQSSGYKAKVGGQRQNDFKQGYFRNPGDKKNQNIANPAPTWNYDKRTEEQKKKIKNDIMNIERAMKRIEDKRIKNEEKINLIMDEIVEMQKSDQVLQVKKEQDLRKCEELSEQNQTLKTDLEIWRKEKKQLSEYLTNEELIQIDSPDYKRQRQMLNKKLQVSRANEFQREQIKDIKNQLADNPEVDNHHKKMLDKLNKRRNKG